MRAATLCKSASFGLFVFGTLCSLSTAHADAALALRAGTPGIGLDLDVGLLDRLSVRVGYSAFTYNRTIDDTDVTYDGKLKLSVPTALFDWYVFNGAFHLTVGGAINGTKVDAVGRPKANGQYDIGDGTYTSAQVGSVKGKFKFGNSVAPYVGIGWGNPVDKEGRFTFLFDMGAIYGGKPDISLDVQCGTAAPQGSALCNQLQQDAAVEKQKLEDDVKELKWFPVLNLGFAVRF